MIWWEISYTSTQQDLGFHDLYDIVSQRRCYGLVDMFLLAFYLEDCRVSWISTHYLFLLKRGSRRADRLTSVRTISQNVHIHKSQTVFEFVKLLYVDVW